MNIKDIRLLECSFSINRDAPDQDSVIGSSLSFESAFDKDTKTVTGVLKTVSQEDKNSPYQFSAEIGGKFILDDGEEEHLKRICEINIPAILLPYLRETIADLTRRAGFPPLHLPIVNFVAAAKQKANTADFH